jgi:hypothetical protein
MRTYNLVDRSGNVRCPRCQESNLRYLIIPAPRLISSEGNTQSIDYFDDLRDYCCKNCDTTFLIADNDCGEEF